MTSPQGKASRTGQAGKKKEREKKKVEINLVWGEVFNHFE